MTLQSEKFGNHDGLIFDGGELDVSVAFAIPYANQNPHQNLPAVYQSCYEASQSGPFDYVFCASKALLDAKPSLEDQIRSVVSTNTSVVILQNGVGAEAPLHAAFPNNTIISAVVWTGGKVLDNGVVQQFNREGLTIGVDWRSDDPAIKQAEKKMLDRVVDILTAGGGDCTVVESIQSERWVKVIW
jgi:2-dehydropantoate 2-reductase